MFVCSFFNLKTVLGTHAHSTLSAHESDAGESDDDGDDGDGDDGGHEDGGGAAMVMMVMMVMMTMVTMRTEVERRWRAVIQA